MLQSPLDDDHEGIQQIQGDEVEREAYEGEDKSNYWLVEYRSKGQKKPPVL
jgi:hypothetical protein